MVKKPSREGVEDGILVKNSTRAKLNKSIILPSEDGATKVDHDCLKLSYRSYQAHIHVIGIQ